MYSALWTRRPGGLTERTAVSDSDTAAIVETISTFICTSVQVVVRPSCEWPLRAMRGHSITAHSANPASTDRCDLRPRLRKDRLGPTEIHGGNESCALSARRGNSVLVFSVQSRPTELPLLCQADKAFDLNSVLLSLRGQRLRIAPPPFVQKPTNKVKYAKSQEVGW